MSLRYFKQAARSRDTVFAGGVLIAAIVLGLASSAEAQTTSPSPGPGQDQAQQPVPVTEPATQPDLSFNVGVATDYVFRGIEQTFDTPQVFGGLDVTGGGFYAGTWASNVDYDDGTDSEIDFYGGWRPEVQGWTLDLGAIVYLYPGQPRGADYDYVEARVGASRTFDRLSVAANAFWSPDFGGPAEEATYVEGSLGHRVAERLTVSGAVGHQQLSESDADYTTWNLGAAYSLTDRIALDLRYYDTDAEDLGEAYEGLAVASLKATF